MALRTSPAAGEDWCQRLNAIVHTMREMSRQTDPQEMVRSYARRMQQLIPVDCRISLSRRELKHPSVRVTRFSQWEDDINPWKESERLPVLSQGLLSELIYGDVPLIINQLEISPDDPSAPFLAGQRSLMALPLYDQGESLNMVVLGRTVPDGFDHDELPERVWMSNLFGRAAQNLVLAEERDEAYRQVDRELQVVADIQRSLLPAEMPVIKTLQIAADYQTSRRAGGDYYDLFQLSDDKWGILIADVSGHGTPAAVMMAVTHCIAHIFPGEPLLPGRLLQFINRELTSNYTLKSGHFVTAFYGVYDANSRQLTYACAGHNPPRLLRCGFKPVQSLDDANMPPMGFMAGIDYEDRHVQLEVGDRLVLYTDGIVEAQSPQGELYGTDRLDAALCTCSGNASQSIQRVLTELELFTDGQPAADDRTLLIADVQ
ncbi:MAG: GAF domain-containing SpoIIE family protein phosphatase [Planctomycetaceae bacterium]